MAKNSGDKPIKPPSTGVLITKLAIAAIFAVTGFVPAENSGRIEVINILVGLIMGAAIAAWGLLGYKNSQKAWEEHQASMPEQNKNRIRICKQCGAHSTGDFCEYCGAPLED